MEVIYTLTVADYFRAAPTRYRNIFRFQPVIAVAFVLVLFLILASQVMFVWAGVGHGFYRHGIWSYLWMVTRSSITGLCVAAVVMYPVLYFIFNAFAGQRTLRLEPERLIWRTQTAEAKVDWQEMHWPQDNGHTFYFPLKHYKTMKGKGQGIWKTETVNLIILPRTAFSHPADAERFLAMAQAYWNAAKNGMPLPADTEEDGKTWPPAPRTL